MKSRAPHLLCISTLALAAFTANPQETAPPAAITRWSEAILRQKSAWYASPEARAAAGTVLLYQSREGGWPKNHDLFKPPASPAALAEIQKREGNTIDNGATTGPMRFLALVATASGDEPCRTGVARGVDYLLAAQYPNGGFPQFYALRDHGYYSHITYNDNAMIADPAAGPLWARFYELGTNRPLFRDRHSKPVYTFAEIDRERRGGYSYYGTWDASLLATDYPQWRAKHKLPATATNQKHSLGECRGDGPAE